MTIDRRALVLWVGLLVSAAQDAHAWRVSINGKADKADVANAVALDPAGNIVAVGSILDDDSYLSVVKLAAATGAQLWRRALAIGQAHAVAVDAAGDVVVAGRISTDGFTLSRFTVMKLAGATGDIIWRRDGIGVAGSMTSVATDGAGDVVAVGSDDYLVHVAKFSGVTGDVLWDRDIGATASQYPGTNHLALDGNADVVVAGAVNNLGTGDDWLIAKLSGTTGADIWQRELDGGDHGYEFTNSVVVDSGGHVIAAGYWRAPNYHGRFMVRKFSGTDGTDIWQEDVGEGSAWALALDAGGDVLAGGALDDAVTFQDEFTVVRLSAETGSELWRTALDEDASIYYRYGLAFAIGIRGDGAIVAAGSTMAGPSPPDFTVAAFAGATGALLWRFDLDGGTYDDQASAVAVGSTGNVVAAGFINDQRKGLNFTVVNLENGPAPGKQLVVTDRGDPSRRTVKFQSTDPTLVTAAAGSVNDPTIAGGTMRLTNPVTAEVAVLALPAANWEARPVRGGVAWEYGDASDLPGSCRSIRIEPLRRITAKCRGAGIGFSLDEATQGALALAVETGTMRHCAIFGGSVATDRPGIFKARNAPVPASCP